MTKWDGLPPHDVQAEEAVLAAALLDPSAVDTCLARHLSANHFFRETHRAVYTAVLRLVADGLEPTIIGVGYALNGTTEPDGGWEPWLADLVGRHFTAIGVETHIEIVLNCARLRDVIEGASEVAGEAYTGVKATEVVSRAVERFSGLLEPSGTGVETLGYQSIDVRRGLKWGLPVLDTSTMGVVGGRLAILAGSSGQGKSALATQIARSVAKQGGGVVIFTMEMSTAEVAFRLIHAEAHVRMPYSLDSAGYDHIEAQRVADAQQEVQSMGIACVDRPQTASSIIATVHLLNAQRKLALVVVDYLGLVQRPANDESEATNLKAITGALKQMAMAEDVCVLLLSQMNRASLSEYRAKDSRKMECIVNGEKYPAPFKESLMGGAVENDADLVLMLQRHPTCDHHVELCIVKSRNGVEAHGLLIDEFEYAGFRTLTNQEIEHYASGDMTIYRMLKQDQGVE